jgi:hypothetical protein
MLCKFQVYYFLYQKNVNVRDENFFMQYFALNSSMPVLSLSPSRSFSLSLRFLQANSSMNSFFEQSPSVKINFSVDSPLRELFFADALFFAHCLKN